MDHGEEKLDRASKVESNDNGSGRSFASQKDRHGGRKSSAKVLHADNAAISSPDECKGAEAESNKGARDSNASFAVRRWNATPYSFLADMLPGATSMRKLFHAQSKASRKLAEVKKTESCPNGACPGAGKEEEEERTAERKVVAVVLAFQRWRHTQLKNIFSQELKKVLEEARQDEASMAALETELESSEQRLAEALEDSANLRAQLIDRSSCTPAEGHNHDLTGQEIEREMMMALERLAAAETEVHRRDNQIRQLKDHLQNVEEKGARIDGQLHANLALLQAEKCGVLEENRFLLEQLARRDEELGIQGEEIERLKSMVSRLADRQTMDQQHADALKTEHTAEVQSLQDQLRQAYGAKYAKELELASFTERCTGLGQERETLMQQLHHAVERANMASCRAEELQLKLQCAAEDRAKASEEVAGEMIENLRKLTDHMREIESTLFTTNRHTYSSRDGHASKPSTEYKPSLAKHGCNETRVLTPEAEKMIQFLIPPSPIPDEPRLDEYHLGGNASQSSTKGVPVVEHRTGIPQLEDQTTTSLQLFDTDKCLARLKKWATWKWRWAASAARAELLAKQLHSIELVNYVNSVHIRENHHLVANTVDGERQPQKLLKAHLGNVSTCTETEFNDTCTEHKMVPLIFSAWRAFARTSVLEKRAISRSASLNKMMEALPWWIRRVGERRLLERNFFHWQLLTLRSGQQIKPSKKRKQQSVESVPSRGIAEFDRSTKQVTRNEDSSLVDKKPPGMKGPLTTNQQKRLQKIGCPTCSESRNVTEEGRISVVPHTVEKDPDVNYSNGMAFTSRALRALQRSLQQEVDELQTLLSQEMHALQQQGEEKPQGESTRGFSDEHSRPDRKRTLKSVWGVCNNLAQTLTDVRGQLYASGLGQDKPVLKQWRRRYPHNTVSFALESEKDSRARKQSPRQGLMIHSPLSRQPRIKALHHQQHPWIGGGIRIASPGRIVHQQLAAPTARDLTHLPFNSETYLPHYALPITQCRYRHSDFLQSKQELASPLLYSSPRHHYSPAMHAARHTTTYPGEVQRRQESPPPQIRRRNHRPTSVSKTTRAVKSEATSVMKKATTSAGESVSRQTTVLEIIPNGNEIAIHTKPAEEEVEEEAQTMPKPVLHTERKGPAVAAAQALTSSHPKKPNVETKLAAAAAAAVLKKTCIGTEYANLLSAEISRLQEGRCGGSTGDKILKTKNCKEANLTQIVAKRPSWSRP